MEVSEVKILPCGGKGEKLVAYATITIDDCFVVRDVKVIRGKHGMFVAMPSRKLTSRCPRCRSKNPLQARFCCECGRALSRMAPSNDAGEREKLFADIAHPITQECRDMIEERVISACMSSMPRSEADFRGRGERIGEQVAQC